MTVTQHANLTVVAQFLVPIVQCDYSFGMVWFACYTHVTFVPIEIHARLQHFNTEHSMLQCAIGTGNGAEAAARPGTTMYIKLAINLLMH